MAAELEIREFEPGLRAELEAFADRLGLAALRNWDFVSHYYLGQAYSRLYVALEGGACVGIIGVDQLQFATAAGPRRVAFATNFHSQLPGVGGMLWLTWMKAADWGLVFGGSEDTHRILRARQFSYHPGVHLYSYNKRYEGYPQDRLARAWVKAGLRRWQRRRLADYASRAFLRRFAEVRVVERERARAELLPRSSPFQLRFAPDLAYLQWRYNPGLGYVRYRWFEIQRSGQTAGYCIVNDGPSGMMVAHADGSDPEVLAAGMVKAMFAVGEQGEPKRAATLASSHPAMQAVFEQAGMHRSVTGYPLAHGSLRRRENWGNPAEWLINLGIGDNDLRTAMFWPGAEAAPR